MQWTIDDLEVSVVSGGRMRMDGGGMFGVVPKPLWSRTVTADDQNRIALDTNCLLIRTGDRCLLVDSGYGGKGSDRQRRHFDFEEGEPLLRNLAAMGVRPDDIDTVILTHLHFDHAGGCTRRGDADGLEPVFPRARYFVQRGEWEDATSGAPEFAGQFLSDDFIPLGDADAIDLIDGDTEVVPGVRCRLIGGHTRGHQILALGSGDRPILYLADLCPTAAHLPTMWSMAYDLFPLDVRRTKPRILAEVVASGCPVLFGHDPTTKGATLEEPAEGVFTVGRPLDGTEADLRAVADARH